MYELNLTLNGRTKTEDMLFVLYIQYIYITLGLSIIYVQKIIQIEQNFFFHLPGSNSLSHQ